MAWGKGIFCVGVGACPSTQPRETSGMMGKEISERIAHAGLLSLSASSSIPQRNEPQIGVIRRSESTDAARNILINSLPKFPPEAIIYYNLACYDCQLGQIASAKQYLKQAFRIDPNWISQALEDEDLKPLWDSLQAMIG